MAHKSTAIEAEKPSFNPPEVSISAWRLRLGVVLFICWWLPVYVLVPSFCVALNITTSEGRSKVLLSVLAVQTLIGVIGLLVIGRQIMGILRHTKPRHLPAALWRLFWKGA